MTSIAQPMLQFIAAAPEGEVTTAQVVAELDRCRKIIATTAATLRRRKLIESPARGVYRITQAGRDWLASGRTIASGQGRRRIERTNGLRERAWWLMRELRKFTVADLLTTLADGSERDAHGNLGRYLSVLEQAGVVQRMRRRVPGAAVTSNGHILWWLKRDLGRMAPVWRQRHRTVYDPNSGDVLALASADAAVTGAEGGHHE
ncbi:MAG TPA: hypothetical protein PLR02_14640 [Rhodocyclaceae bacterium]|jgi:predicted DNA-binding ribbon-helix-helix protein|nr:hypothetical protein [Rhodocyclaceae bacterium]